MNNRSPVIIPRKRLNLWSIFRDVGPEVENILSSAKLAHVGEGKGFVVTLEDDTYSYISDVNNGEVNVTRIPELSQFFVGSIFLALTDDGALYSWINDHPMRYGVLKCDEDVKNLGRIQPGTLDWSQPDLTTLLATPHLVGGALTEKKVQTVALSFRGRVMALTTGGEVYQWGERGPHGSPEPVLIAQQHFHRQAVISIACTDHISVAINFSGEVCTYGVLL
ncbi:putative E3 ubiquitin-protein ligase HERC2 [Folsomia candida]|uniref:Putative E3 ubiquitin-protein ligase HERC2 n=1 Tax=Folsomia candida TaxID=158441 RepID=A0A226DTG2_FOLCA|nr:putative E3 ubiquitin-protein ligase HERC2 [Folsomia candida]